jgi:hypothetical protein
LVTTVRRNVIPVITFLCRKLQTTITAECNGIVIWFAVVVLTNKPNLATVLLAITVATTTPFARLTNIVLVALLIAATVLFACAIAAALSTLCAASICGTGSTCFTWILCAVAAVAFADLLFAHQTLVTTVLLAITICARAAFA